MSSALEDLSAGSRRIPWANKGGELVRRVGCSGESGRALGGESSRLEMRCDRWCIFDDSPDRNTRVGAAEALLHLGDRCGWELLVRVLDEHDEDWTGFRRAGIAELLAGSGDPRAADVLLGALERIATGSRAEIPPGGSRLPGCRCTSEGTVRSTPRTKNAHALRFRRARRSGLRTGGRPRACPTPRRPSIRYRVGLLTLAAIPVPLTPSQRAAVPFLLGSPLHQPEPIQLPLLSVRVRFSTDSQFLKVLMHDGFTFSW